MSRIAIKRNNIIAALRQYPQMPYDQIAIKTYSSQGYVAQLAKTHHLERECPIYQIDDIAEIENDVVVRRCATQSVIPVRRISTNNVVKALQPLASELRKEYGLIPYIQITQSSSGTVYRCDAHHMSISIEDPTRAGEEVSIRLPFDAFAEAIKDQDTSDPQYALKQGRLDIGGHRIKGSKHYAPVVPHSVITNYSFMANGGPLFKAFKRAAAFASNDSNRPLLRSVHWEPADTEGRSVMVSTDSFKLQWQHLDIGVPDSVDIPKAVVQKFPRICGAVYGNAATVQAPIEFGHQNGITLQNIAGHATKPSWNYSYSDNAIGLRMGQVTMTSMTIGGDYPKWRELIPQRWGKKSKATDETLKVCEIVDTNELYKSLKTVTADSKELREDVLCSFDQTDQCMSIHASHIDGLSVRDGAALISTSAQYNQEHLPAISFKHKVLVGALSAIKGERISLIARTKQPSPAMFLPGSWPDEYDDLPEEGCLVMSVRDSSN